MSTHRPLTMKEFLKNVEQRSGEDLDHYHHHYYLPRHLEPQGQCQHVHNHRDSNTLDGGSTRVGGGNRSDSGGGGDDDDDLLGLLVQRDGEGGMEDVVGVRIRKNTTISRGSSSAKSSSSSDDADKYLVGNISRLGSNLEDIMMIWSKDDSRDGSTYNNCCHAGSFAQNDTKHITFSTAPCVTGTEGVFSSSGRVVVNDDEELGTKMTKAMLNMDMGDENEAATSLSDIEMEEMESVDIFNFVGEEGSRERHLKQQRQQDGGREGRVNIEWNEEVDSLGVESELPFEVTAWDWSPSLDGGRNSVGYSGEESPVCVTETEHLDESGRFGFFHAPLAKGYQICPDLSVRMCDSIGDDGFEDFADHNFKPASIENPLPSLEAVTGYKVKTQKVSSEDAPFTPGVVWQKKTEVDEASTSFDFSNDLWATHKIPDESMKTRDPCWNPFDVEMTGDEVDACTVLCGLYNEPSRICTPSTTHKGSENSGKFSGVASPIHFDPSEDLEVGKGNGGDKKRTPDVTMTLATKACARVLFPSTDRESLCHDTKYSASFASGSLNGVNMFTLTEEALDVIAEQSRLCVATALNSSTRVAAPEDAMKPNKSFKRMITSGIDSRSSKIRRTGGSMMLKEESEVPYSILVSPVDRTPSGISQGQDKDDVDLSPCSKVEAVEWPNTLDLSRNAEEDGVTAVASTVLLSMVKDAPCKNAPRQQPSPFGDGKVLPTRRSSRQKKPNSACISKNIAVARDRKERMIAAIFPSCTPAKPRNLSSRDVTSRMGTPYRVKPTQANLASLEESSSDKETKPDEPDQTPILLNEACEEKWYGYLDRFKAFRTKHGHGCVPTKYPDDQDLAGWATRQRMHYARYIGKSDGKSLLTEKRVHDLTNAGFCWDNQQRGWYAKYDLLCRYVQKYGSVKGASAMKSCKDFPGLAAWIIYQRKCFREFRTPEAKATLKQDHLQRLKLLEAHGFWHA